MEKIDIACSVCYGSGVKMDGTQCVCRSMSGVTPVSEYHRKYLAVESAKDSELAKLRTKLAAVKEELELEKANGAHWAKCYANWVNTDLSARKLIELETELAATQLALKEAREALDNAISATDVNAYGAAISSAMRVLSRPADTTALNRYVAEELRSVAEEGENMDGIFNDAYGAGMKEVAWYCRRRANKLEGK